LWLFLLYSPVRLKRQMLSVNRPFACHGKITIDLSEHDKDESIRNEARDC